MENDSEKELLRQVLEQNVKEQRSSRRWGIFFKLLSAVIALLFIFAIYAGMKSSSKEPEGAHTAIVRISGTIAAKSASSAKNINEALGKAFSNAGVRGVVLEMNSPGGSPVQAGLVYDEIMRLRALYPNKKVYVVAGDLLASGAYYIASAADEIHVNRATLTGSIGAMISSFGLTEMMKKIGVERRLITSGGEKGFMDPFSELTDAQRARASVMLTEIATQFIDAVKKGRGGKLKDDGEMFKARVYVGTEAVNNGLADGFKTTRELSADVIKAPETFDYTVEEDFTERLMKKVGTSFGEGVASSAVRFFEMR